MRDEDFIDYEQSELYPLASRWGDKRFLEVDSANPAILNVGQLVEVTAAFPPRVWSLFLYVAGFVTGDKLIVTWNLSIGLGVASFDLPVVVDTSVWGAPPVAIFQAPAVGTLQVTATVQQFLGAGTKRNIQVGAAAAPFTLGDYR